MEERTRERDRDRFADVPEGAREGDPQAWRAIDQRYRQMMKEVCRSTGINVRVRQRLDESDVVQSAFIVAYERLPREGMRTEEQFRRWLIAITLHKLQEKIRLELRALRTVEREARRADDLSDEGSPSPIQIIVGLEERLAVFEALEQLQLEDQELVLWRHVEGATFAEIAEWLECSTDVTRRSYVRVVERIRDIARRAAP